MYTENQIASGFFALAIFMSPLSLAIADDFSDSVARGVGEELTKIAIDTLAELFQWTPGKPHPTLPHIVAAEKEGSWTPAPGYWWDGGTLLAILVGESPKNPRVEWSPGRSHPRHPGLVAADTEVSWQPAEGWAWLHEDNKDLSVTEQEYPGVGFQFSTEHSHNGVQILHILPDSPAGRASLRRGMILKSVDGIGTADRDADGIVKLLRGPVGQKLLLVMYDPVYKNEKVVEIEVGLVKSGKTDRSPRRPE